MAEKTGWSQGADVPRDANGFSGPCGPGMSYDAAAGGCVPVVQHQARVRREVEAIPMKDRLMTLGPRGMIGVAAVLGPAEAQRLLGIDLTK